MTSPLLLQLAVPAAASEPLPSSAQPHSSAHSPRSPAAPSSCDAPLVSSLSSGPPLPLSSAALPTVEIYNDIVYYNGDGPCMYMYYPNGTLMKMCLYISERHFRIKMVLLHGKKLWYNIMVLYIIYI